MYLMTESTPDKLAREDSDMELFGRSPLFHSASCQSNSEKKDNISVSNLNPFKSDMQPLSGPNPSRLVSKTRFDSPGKENRIGSNQCGVGDKNKVVTTVNEVDEDINYSVPSSPLRAIKISTARKRHIGKGYVGPCTPKKKNNVLPTPPKAFKQGEIESMLSFEPIASSNNSKNMNRLLSPLAQYNFQRGIGNDKGFTANTELYSFTRSPIEEESHLENSSPYAENEDASIICATKIRRLNLDYNWDDCYSNNKNTTITLQQQEPIKLNKPHKYSKVPRDDFISPKNVTSFDEADYDVPSPPSSPFASPPLPRRHIGVDDCTHMHSPFQGRKDIPLTTPMLKRKASRSPCLSQNENTDRSNEETSRLTQDFQVLGNLGDGSFGTVYECISRLDGCRYAVKATKHKAKGEADRKRMLNEVYALAALSELTDTAVFHIVGYHQAWMEENRLYIQTELCTSTLREEIKKGKDVVYDTRRQFKVLREMLLALDLIHRNGMVHLDIKPDNIFVKNNQYKLGDFGLVTKSSVRGDVEEGDCRYMCNDLLRGNREDLTKCDIFSLGATMYEIALRRTLPTHGEEWHQIRAGVLSPLPHTSNQLCEIIRIMLHPSRDQRPSAAMLLQRRQLLSEDQKQLILERNRVREANRALAVKEARLKALTLPSPKKALTRANTLG